MRRLVGFCVAVTVVAAAFSAQAMTYGEAWAAYKRADYATAIRGFRECAEQKDMQCQHNIGWMYYSGEGVERDYVQAAKWFRKAAEQDFAESQSRLGLMYYYGQGVARDYTQAGKWFRKCSEQGLAWCHNNLGWLYENGEGVERDYVQAAKWFRKAAEHRNADAQNSLALMYKDGRGVERDLREAVKWFTRAGAWEGFAESQYNLAVMYENGLGVTRDYGEALEWYYLAGRKDDVDRLYRSGLAGTATKDGAAAVKKVQAEHTKLLCSDTRNSPPIGVLRPLAVQGNADAQRLLAEYHHNAADDLDTNDYESEKEPIYSDAYMSADGKYRLWMSKAAEGGNAAAQADVGIWSHQASDPLSHSKAIFWLNKAARQGCHNAFYMLLLHYKNVAREKTSRQSLDRLRAVMWAGMVEHQRAEGGEEYVNWREVAEDTGLDDGQGQGSWTAEEVAQTHKRFEHCERMQWKDCGVGSVFPERVITPAQRAQANTMIDRCIKSNYQDCAYE